MVAVGGELDLGGSPSLFGCFDDDFCPKTRKSSGRNLGGKNGLFSPAKITTEKNFRGRDSISLQRLAEEKRP